MSLTNIQNFYTGQTIFITGGTGFLGKLIIENLLRKCYDLNKIYILVRIKKGVSEEERFKAIFDCECFEPLKQKYPDFLKKCVLMQGDCVKPGLGLSSEDRDTIVREVTTIFHVAATVRFDQHIKTATYINVRATWDLLTIAKEVNNLKAFVHVSTAYSHSPRFVIDEQFYEAPMTSDNLLKLVETLDDETLKKITPDIIKEWPNTYTYTKCVAEDAIEKYGKDLPIAVVRPAIVTSTYVEPIPGWIDNIYGINGVFIATHVGLLRCIQINNDNIAEIICADVVVNNILAAAWDVGKIERKQPENIPIYNLVSQNLHPHTYRMTNEKGAQYKGLYPSNKMIWYPFILLHPNYYVFMTMAFFLHFLPAALVDLLLLVIGKKPFLLQSYRKLHVFINVISYFGTNTFTFSDKNVLSLYDKCSKEDQELFNFHCGKVDAKTYLTNFLIGGRKYISKDTDDNLPQARLRYKIFTVLHYIVCGLLLILLYKFAVCIFLLIKNSIV